MLRDDFYTVHDVSKNEHELICKIVFNPDHAIFKGHFPDHPVVPGVCMMELVKELLQDQLGEKLMLANSDTVKFLQLIVPGNEPAVKINWKRAEEGYQVNAVLKSEANFHFKLTGRYIVVQ